MLIIIEPNIVNENQFRFYNQVTKVLKKKYIIDIFLFFFIFYLLKNDFDNRYNEFNINLYLFKQCK